VRVGDVFHHAAFYLDGDSGDLRGQDDLDAEGFRGGIAKGTLRHVLRLHDDVLRGALDCAARADDTIGFQARYIQDAMAVLCT